MIQRMLDKYDELDKNSEIVTIWVPTKAQSFDTANIDNYMMEKTGQIGHVFLQKTKFGNRAKQLQMRIYLENKKGTKNCHDKNGLVTVKRFTRYQGASWMQSC